MRSARRITLLLVLMTTAAWAQHSGGFRSGGGRLGPGLPPIRPGIPTQGLGTPPIGFGIPPVTGFAGGITPRGFTRGFRFHNRRSGNFANGYFPFLWDYPALGDYYYPAYPPSDEYPPARNTIIVETTPPPPPPAPEPVRAEMKEYKWSEQPAAPGEQPATFTIALKDGSQRHSVAAWIENGSLHYIDSDGHQAALPASAIDRGTTERLNREKNLNLQLPPSYIDLETRPDTNNGFTNGVAQGGIKNARDRDNVLVPSPNLLEGWSALPQKNTIRQRQKDSHRIQVRDFFQFAGVRRAAAQRISVVSATVADALIELAKQKLIGG